MAAQAAAVLRDKRKRIAAEEKKRDGEDSGSPDPARRVIPVGPGGVRQLPQQSGRRRNREMAEPSKEFETFRSLAPSELQESSTSIEGGGSADVILYVGLAMICFGLLITFLGLGEGTSGFKTTEMKLIGPSLVGCGVFFAVLRILFCTVPAFFKTICGCCCRKSKDAKKLVDKDDLMTTKANLSRTMRSLHPPRPAPRTVKTVKSSHPHFINDPEDGRKGKSKKGEKPSKQKKTSKAKKHEEVDSDSSSTFSLDDGMGPEMVFNPPHLGGSTKNLKAGGIILNSNKLSR